MAQLIVQIPSIILPTVWSVGNEVEAIADLVEHTSIEFSVEYLQEKMIGLMIMEVVGVGAPGNLQAWVELSPYPSTVSPIYWGAIGGGGGVLPPAAPIVVVGTGVNGTVHTVLIPWNIHSAYARLVVQTPANPGLPNDFWMVQALFSGKG